jgi:hypothetical protein
MENMKLRVFNFGLIGKVGVCVETKDGKECWASW